MAGNGFPRLDLHDLKDVWHLGNMAREWAMRPVALGPEDMTLFMELSKRYGLEPAEVLLEFQKMQYGDPFSSGPHRMPEPTTDRPSPEPRQGRHDVESTQQSGDLGWRDEKTGLMSGPIPKDIEDHTSGPMS